MFRTMADEQYIQEERIALNLKFPPCKLPGCAKGTEFSLECSVNCSKPELKTGVLKPRMLAPGASCVLCKVSECRTL